LRKRFPGSPFCRTRRSSLISRLAPVRGLSKSPSTPHEVLIRNNPTFLLWFSLSPKSFRRLKATTTTQCGPSRMNGVRFCWTTFSLATSYLRPPQPMSYGMFLTITQRTFYPCHLEPPFGIESVSRFFPSCLSLKTVYPFSTFSSINSLPAHPPRYFSLIARFFSFVSLLSPPTVPQFSAHYNRPGHARTSRVPFTSFSV